VTQLHTLGTLLLITCAPSRLSLSTPVVLPLTRHSRLGSPGSPESDLAPGHAPPPPPLADDEGQDGPDGPRRSRCDVRVLLGPRTVGLGGPDGGAALHEAIGRALFSRLEREGGFPGRLLCGVGLARRNGGEGEMRGIRDEVVPAAMRCAMSVMQQA